MDDARQRDPGNEVFDVVDGQGRPVGRALRRECHANPALVHPAVHVFVFNCAGSLFLQQRSMSKDVQPGRWDTSVGGHLHPGEDPCAGARREMREELGIETPLAFSHEYVWRSPRETEYVRAFVAHFEGPFRLDPDEVADGRFWTFDEIAASVGRGVFTPNFEHELDWLRRDPSGAVRDSIRREGPRPRGPEEE
jgi:isopentenyldiphosphate isomerase